MARIPIIQQDLTVAGPINTRGASADDFAPGLGTELSAQRAVAGADAAAAQAGVTAKQLSASASRALGSSLGDTSEALYKWQERKETTKAAVEVTKRQDNWFKRVQAQTLDGTIDTDKSLEDFDKETEKYTAGYETNAARDYVAKATASLRGDIMLKSATGQADVAAGRDTAAAEEILTTLGSSSYTSPIDTVQNIKRFNEFLATKASHIPARDLEKIKVAASKEIARQGGLGLARQNPKKAIEAMNTAPWTTLMDGQHRDQIIETAQREIREREREAREKLILAKAAEVERQQTSAASFINKLWTMPQGEISPQLHREIANLHLHAGITESLHSLVEHRIGGGKNEQQLGRIAQFAKDFSEGPNGEPAKRTDTTELLTAIPEIGIGGYNFVLEVAEGRKSPEGRALNELKKKALNSLYDPSEGLVIPSLNGGRPNTSLADSAFADAMRLEKEGLDSGVSKAELWSPLKDNKPNPNYVLRAKENYQILDPRARIAAQALLARGQKLPARSGPAPFIPAFAKPLFQRTADLLKESVLPAAGNALDTAKALKPKPYVPDYHRQADGTVIDLNLKNKPPEVTHTSFEGSGREDQ